MAGSPLVEGGEVGEQVGAQLLAPDQIGERDRIGVGDAVQAAAVEAQHAVDGERADALAPVERGEHRAA